MRLEEAERQAWQLLDGYDLVREGWVFEWDRAVKRFGSCRFNPNRITLSRTLTERATPEVVEEIIRHEIAHALAGPYEHHGREWQRMCAVVGIAPKRCHTESTEDSDKWVAVCPECKREYRRARLTRRTRHGRCICPYTSRPLEWKEIVR